MLTTAQLQTLKAYIAADPTLSSQPNTNVGNSIIGGSMNALASPAFTVWRTSVALEEITSDGFTWTLVDALSAGTARIWEWMFDNGSRSINPSKANIRQGIADVWSGTAGKLAVQASVLGHCKRPALLIEKILATGTGSDAVPATMGYEGTVTPDEIEQARSL